jgi:GntR family transcriptional regulator
MKKILDERLHEKAEKAIIEHYMKSEHNRLEPEPVLAEMLGVSRTTVRAAMNSLVQKGYLTKRKGIGNFINRSVINTRTRIDGVADFSEQIRQLGYEPTLEISFIKKLTPTVEIREKLDCAEDEQVLSFLFHYLAGKQSAVRIYTQTPESHFQSMPPDHASFIGDEVYYVSFYKGYCDQDLSHYLSFTETTQNSEVNREFGLPDAHSLVVLRQDFYNLFDQCVTYGDIYLNPKIIKLSIFSRYIGPITKTSL